MGKTTNAKHPKTQEKYKDNERPGLNTSDYITYCRKEIREWSQDDLRYFAARSLLKTVSNNALMKRIMPTTQEAEKKFAKSSIKPDTRTLEQKENDRKVGVAMNKILNGDEPKRVYRELHLTQEQQAAINKELPALMEQKEREDKALSLRRGWGSTNIESAAEIIKRFKQRKKRTTNDEK